MKFIVIPIIVVFISILALSATTDDEDDMIMCPMDAKECDDGSYVSREPKNNCEFAPCPSESKSKPEASPDTNTPEKTDQEKLEEKAKDQMAIAKHPLYMVFMLFLFVIL
jgi:hypothetical protein